MNESYDPSTIVIAMIVFYWYLARAWKQPPPPDESGKARKPAATGPSHELAAIAINTRTASPRAAQGRDPLPASTADHPLAAIRAEDPRFDDDAFLAGAARAYELVLNAYAEEDVEALDAVLGPQASQDFKDAITARRARGERLMLAFIGLKEIDVVDARAESNLAEITVRFTSEAVAATYAADGSLIDGYPDRVAEMTDTWTFARCITSRNPNWTLIAT